jgi:uncharacterized protein YbjT (DUF2867 family)
MHVVVSGTGQLGTVLVRPLVAAGKPVRAFVLPTIALPALDWRRCRVPFDDLSRSQAWETCAPCGEFLAERAVLHDRT